MVWSVRSVWLIRWLATLNRWGGGGGVCSVGGLVWWDDWLIGSLGRIYEVVVLVDSLAYLAH